MLCSKCGQSAEFKCERCLEPYCSSQCQVNDWQDHKSRCYKFPNLVPINIVKSVSSNLHLDKIAGNQRRNFGSSQNLNDSRRSGSPFNNSKPKPKMSLNDDDFSMVAKVPSDSHASSSLPIVKSSSEKPTTWRTAFPPSDGFFDAIVQFKEEIENEKRIIWVTDLKYDSSLRKLLAEINRSIDQKFPCTKDDIYKGALVAAPLDKMLYRAEVLEILPDTQKATVRLIDYGNELRISYTQLFAPIPIMCNLNAYAFRVCLPNDYGPVEIESIITIKIFGGKQVGNYYNVECKLKTISLQLPIEMFNNDPVLKLVKCFSDGRNALLRLCSGGADDEELDNLLNSPQSLSFEYETEPKVGAFVAARTLMGWRRARLLGYCEKLQQFLIYAIDEGVVVLSPHIKKVPEAFITQPIRVFAISTKAADCMLSEAMLSTAKHLTLRLLPTSSTTMKESKTQLPCGLFDADRKILDVAMASVFAGFVSELGLKLWHECISEGDTVIISHVLTYKEIYIASQKNNEYPQILMGEYSKSSPYEADETIEKTDIVMYASKYDDVSQFRRGELNTSVHFSILLRFESRQTIANFIRMSEHGRIDILIAELGVVIKCEGSQFKILDIDSGSEQIISRNVLRKPTFLASSLPVRCSRVALMFLESIPTPIADNKALEALETCMENAVEFDVTFSEKNTADLLFRTKEKQSLCKKLLPMAFEPTTKQTPALPVATVTNNNLLPLSPPNTPIACQAAVVPSPQASNMVETEPAAIKQKLFSINDLKILPITCGEKVPLYVLDPSTIMNTENPYITAADFNKEFFGKLGQYLKDVAEYCHSEKAPKIGYAPNKMEICLSVFADDGEWYRALCMEHKPDDTFVVMFLDYGNISKVNKKDIMPMISELMFPSNANMVYIEDITTKEQRLEFLKNVEKNPVIYANVRKLEDGEVYVAKICF